MDIEKAAKAIYEAEKGCCQITMISQDNPDMNIDDAYAIQLKNIEKRLEAGEKIIGMKIGLTSKGMQQLLNVDVPDYGHLMDNMMLHEGERCHTKELCQPKV